MKLKTKWKYKFVHSMEAALLIVAAFIANDILTIFHKSEGEESYHKYKLYHIIFIFIFDLLILVLLEIFFNESP